MLKELGREYIARRFLISFLLKYKYYKENLNKAIIKLYLLI